MSSKLMDGNKKLNDTMCLLSENKNEIWDSKYKLTNALAEKNQLMRELNANYNKLVTIQKSNISNKLDKKLLCDLFKYNHTILMIDINGFNKDANNQRQIKDYGNMDYDNMIFMLQSLNHSKWD